MAITAIMKTLVLPAPAKLNLFLHIIGRRHDGYHLLQTVFQLLDYGDELTFSLREDQQIVCTGLEEVAAENNLIVKAAKLLQHMSDTSLGIDIKLTKHIPIGGGLGGGSSDAATTLVALNHLWNLNLSKETLCELGLQLGADVPVFIHGKTAWAEGIGEQLTPLILPEKWFVVLVPNCSVTTKEIFSKTELTRDTSPITIRAFLTNSEILKNDCETVVRKNYPSIDATLKWLEQFAPSKLTGSGSCIFATFEQKEQALAVSKKIKQPWQSFIAKGINESPLLNLIK